VQFYHKKKSTPINILLFVINMKNMKSRVLISFHSLNEILNRRFQSLTAFSYLCPVVLNLPCSWAARDSCWWRHCTCISWSLVISEMVLRYTIIVKITATAQPPYKARRPPRPLPSREPLITVDRKKQSRLLY